MTFTMARKRILSALVLLLINVLTFGLLVSILHQHVCVMVGYTIVTIIFRLEVRFSFFPKKPMIFMCNFRFRDYDIRLPPGTCNNWLHTTYSSTTKNNNDNQHRYLVTP